MADPEAVDAVERRDRVGVLDAFGRLDLAEERACAGWRRRTCPATAPGR